MRPATYAIAAALMAALSGTATAQTATTPQTTTTTTTLGQTSTMPVMAGQTRSHWTLAGFVGTNFATTNDNVDIDSTSTLNFGGQLGYLWHGVFGAELLADFAPSMELTNFAFLNEPDVNSYMANAIGAIPLGAEGQVEPYVSGGFGAIQVRADVFDFLDDNLFDDTILDDISTSSNVSKFGGNIGGGLMAFAGHIGFRTDVRYYRSMSDDSPSLDLRLADTVTDALLSGLGYWRANVGLALRW